MLELAKSRFLAPHFFNYADILDEEYAIKIHYQQSNVEKIEDAALTPITLVGDAIMLMKEIALIPFRE